METLTPELLELANGFGVATEWWDWQGRHHFVPASTVRAVLAGLGVDTTTPDAARNSVVQRRRSYWRRMLPPCVVMREKWTPWIRVHVPHGRPASCGSSSSGAGAPRRAAARLWVPPRRGRTGGMIGEATFQMPG